jgi:hypothetical protein
MTESQTPSRFSPAAHRTITRKAPRAAGRQDRHPRTLPAAGHSLLEGIDAVLPHLTAPTRQSASQLADDLRLALARTAARGDTCRVQAAADGVRHAADLLAAGSPEGARDALRDARNDLVNVTGRIGSH